MKLAVGFVTYNQNSARYLDVFLPSLKQALAFLPINKYAVLAFDNSSQEHNQNRLALEFFAKDQAWPIVYFGYGKNLGFGPSYNQLIKEALRLKAEYFLIINPDTLLTEKALELMLKALEKDKDLAAVSPKILRWDFANNRKTEQIDSCGLVIRSGLRFSDLGHGERDRGQHDRTEIVAPSGAAGLFRLQQLKKIRQAGHYFDESFFMYKEDCDLAYRLRLAGCRSILEPEAIIYHDRTAASYGKGFRESLAARRAIDKKIRAWSFRNQHRLFVKYFRYEHLGGRLRIVGRVIFLLLFSLILEQFNLKEYKRLFAKRKS